MSCHFFFCVCSRCSNKRHLIKCDRQKRKSKNLNKETSVQAVEEYFWSFLAFQQGQHQQSEKWKFRISRHLNQKSILLELCMKRTDLLSLLNLIKRWRLSFIWFLTEFLTDSVCKFAKYKNFEIMIFGWSTYTHPNIQPLSVA